jgi:hypothetical protein
MHGPTHIFWANLTPFSLQPDGDHRGFTAADVIPASLTGGAGAALLFSAWTPALPHPPDWQH